MGWLVKAELNTALTAVVGTVFGVHAVVVFQSVVLPFHVDNVESASAMWPHINAANKPVNAYAAEGYTAGGQPCIEAERL